MTKRQLSLRVLLVLVPLSIFALAPVGFADEPVVTDGSSDAAPDAPVETALERALARARSVESDLVGVLEKVTNASVTVVHHARLPRRMGGTSDSPLLVAGAGSGVIVDYGGIHVVTNAHVVNKAANVEIITHDGRHLPVTILARDEARDLAVLKLKGSTAGLTAVELDKASSTELREGAWVVATGNPFMLAHDGRGSATLGVFSGARGTPKSGATSGAGYLLQHDAEINPGNSGGPLWSRRGELLGINGAIVTRSMMGGGGPSYTGTSISVPVTEVRSFLDRVLSPTPKNVERVAAKRPAAKPQRSTVGKQRSGHGLRLVTSRDGRNRPDGALVIGVARKSTIGASSARTRLQSGDRITHLSVSGTRYVVRTSREFNTLLTKHGAAGTVSIHYVRFGETRTWTGALLLTTGK